MIFWVLLLLSPPKSPKPAACSHMIPTCSHSLCFNHFQPKHSASGVTHVVSAERAGRACPAAAAPRCTKERSRSAANIRIAPQARRMTQSRPACAMLKTPEGKCYIEDHRRIKKIIREYRRKQKTYIRHHKAS